MEKNEYMDIKRLINIILSKKIFIILILIYVIFKNKRKKKK